MDDRDLGHRIKPPGKLVYVLGGYSGGLGVKDVSTDKDVIDRVLSTVFKKTAKYFPILVMAAQASPVDIRNMRYLRHPM
jgi:hypothetical protein